MARFYKAMLQDGNETGGSAAASTTGDGKRKPLV